MFDFSRFRLGALCVLGISLQSMPHAAAHVAAAAQVPGASRIAFASHRDGNWEIYVMDADGRHQTRLTTRDAQDRFPLWSPDRSKLAFGSQAGAHGWELWVMDADGTDPRRLCSDISAKKARAWSRDGTRIALASAIDGDPEIYSARGDGTGLQRLTTSAGDNSDPSWSPDGKQIAFSSSHQDA